MVAQKWMCFLSFSICYYQYFIMMSILLEDIPLRYTPVILWASINLCAKPALPPLLKISVPTHAF